jgi:hypothetical protein
MYYQSAFVDCTINASPCNVNLFTGGVKDAWWPDPAHPPTSNPIFLRQICLTKPNYIGQIVPNQLVKLSERVSIFTPSSSAIKHWSEVRNNAMLLIMYITRQLCTYVSISY